MKQLLWTNQLLRLMQVLSVCALLMLLTLCINAQATGMPTYEDGLKAEFAGDFIKAVNIYQEVLKTNPDHLSIWLRLADISWSLGDLELTITALSNAARLEPENAELQFKLCQSYSMLQKPEQAFYAIDKAIALNPRKVEYWEARASIANWLGKYDEAGRSLQKVIELSPDSAEAEVNLARAQKWGGKLTNSVRTYKSFLSKNPERKDIVLELAMAEAERGNYPSAKKIIEDYHIRFGHDSDSLAHLARIYAWDDMPNRSLSIVDPLLELKHDDYELKYTRMVALRYNEQFSQALQILHHLEKLRPNSQEVYNASRFVKTPIRHNVTGGFNFYHDSDSIDSYHTYLKGEYFLSSLTRLYAKAEFNLVRANVGSGLENISGNSSAQRTAYALGIKHRFSPIIIADVFAGMAFTDGHTTPYYGLTVSSRAHDKLKLSLTFTHDYYFPSARTLSMEIQRYLNQASFEWRPDLAWTITGSAALNFFTFDNRQWELQIFPRRAILRTEVLNLDLGIYALRTGFKVQDDTNGYYDPALYQKYSFVGIWYWKINDDNGISFTTGIGINKDNTSNSFKSSYEGSIEGFFGIYRDWFLKVRLSGMHNLGVIGAYTGWSSGFSLTRRF